MRMMSAGRRLHADMAGDIATLTGEGRQEILASAPGYEGRRIAIELAGDRATELAIALSPIGASGVGEEAPGGAGVQAASALHLEPAFPNPFHTMVAIPYSVGGAVRRGDRVRLSIHDAAGRCVRVLGDAQVTSERVVARWDGRDTLGRVLPNGVYFTHLIAGDAEASGRVELLR